MLWERPATCSTTSYLSESANESESEPTDTDVTSPASLVQHSQTDIPGPQSPSFSSLLGRKHRPMSAGPVGILVTREVIVDNAGLSVADVEALANADGASLCFNGLGDKRLTRTNTV